MAGQIGGLCVSVQLAKECDHGGGDGGIESIVAGPGIDVDATDPANPIVSNTGVLSVSAEAGETTVGGTAQNPTVGLPNVGPGAGTIGGGGDVVASITLDAQGRVTAATEVAAGGGTVDSVVAGTGISVNSADPANPIVSNTGVLSVSAEAGETTVGGTAANPTVGLPNVGTPGTVGGAGGQTVGSITTDAQGRVTAATAAQGPGVLHIETDSATSTLSWTSLTGDNSSLVGYEIRARIVAGSANTQLGLRINNDSGASYFWNITRNDGVAVDSTSSSSDDVIALHGALIDSGDVIELRITIPVSRNNGTGFNIDKTVIFEAGYVVSGEGAVMRIDHGAGRWGSSSQITRLDIVAQAGSITANGTQASLYAFMRV